MFPSAAALGVPKGILETGDLLAGPWAGPASPSTGTPRGQDCVGRLMLMVAKEDEEYGQLFC